MDLTISGVTVELSEVVPSQYEEICQVLKDHIRPPGPARNGIAFAFLHAVRLCPGANPSDLWHHVIYRTFTGLRGGPDPAQSWKRAGGEALEIALVEYYLPLLSKHDIRFEVLIGTKAKQRAMAEMGLEADVGAGKLDTVLRGLGPGQTTFGSGHVKASLAERVSDDIPASRELMKRGFFSPLLTMDVKSFPAPYGDYLNRGELGSPDEPSEKRKYIENHGAFDNCYSFNSRTVPSSDRTPSGKRIYTLTMGDRPDQFVEDVLSAWRAHSARLTQ
ncbi:MAG: BsaWI family type II restriction enzyme [Thermoplasmata archaeon]